MEAWKSVKSFLLSHFSRLSSFHCAQPVQQQHQYFLWNSQAENVRIMIYDLLGKDVRVFNRNDAAGKHSIALNGTEQTVKKCLYPKDCITSAWRQVLVWKAGKCCCSNRNFIPKIFPSFPDRASHRILSFQTTCIGCAQRSHKQYRAGRLGWWWIHKTRTTAHLDCG